MQDYGLEELQAHVYAVVGWNESVCPYIVSGSFADLAGVKAHKGGRGVAT